MKEPSVSSRSPLGYLAAFTLGIICMGAIVFFTRERSVNGARSGDSVGTESSAPAQQRIHFQRGRSNSITAPLPSSARGLVRQVPNFTSAEPDAGNASVADFRADETVIEPTPARDVVQQPVTFIGSRQGSGSVAPEGTRVSGRVLLTAPQPAERTLPLDPFCAAKHRGPITTRFFVTGRNKGLADVLVVVTRGLPRQEWPVPQDALTLRLRGCIYENHIVAVQIGQPLLVENFDRTTHTINTLLDGNQGGKRALLPRQRPLKYQFSKPERFLRFNCDAHPWEFAYVNVIEHPFFAVTDANGNFAINGLPPGAYTVEAHHRKAGILQKEVIVEQSRNVGINFEFKKVETQTSTHFAEDAEKKEDKGRVARFSY